MNDVYLEVRINNDPNADGDEYTHVGFVITDRNALKIVEGHDPRPFKERKLLAFYPPGTWTRLAIHARFDCTPTTQTP